MAPGIKTSRGVFKECVETTMRYFHEIIDIPAVDEYSILVEVKACSLSLIDDQVMKRLYKAYTMNRYPVGQDIAGIVRDVGAAVSTLKPGDEVVGVIPLDYGQSGCAEFVVLHEFEVTKKPENVTFVDAAGCIGDAVKAYTALHYLGRLTGGDTLLVMDGASSFGSLAIQLAYHWGAKVITTASSEDEKLYLEGLEDQIALKIDLSKRMNPLHNNVRNSNNKGNGGGIVRSACMEETDGMGVDIIVDNGVSLFTDEDFKIITNDNNYTYPVPSKHELISSLAVGGRWITSKCNLQLDPPNSQTLFMKCASVGFLFEHAWTLSSSHQGRYLHILMDIMEKVSDGVITPNIHHTISFEAAADTMACLDEIRVGKVVMKMD